MVIQGVLAFSYKLKVEKKKNFFFFQNASNKLRKKDEVKPDKYEILQ